MMYAMEPDEYRRMAEAEAGHWWYRSPRELVRQEFASRLPKDPLLLDAGCGTGATGGWMRGIGHVIALDIERTALDLYDELHPGAELVRADVAHTGLADSHVDGVLCVTVLYHRAIDDPGSVVREFARVLKPGGSLCLVEPGVRRLRRAHDRHTHAARRFGRSDLVALVESAGLEVKRATGAYTFLVPPAWVKSLIERGDSASDLDSGGRQVGRLLSTLAMIERRTIRRLPLPFGLSIVVVATKPALPSERTNR